VMETPSAIGLDRHRENASEFEVLISDLSARSSIFSAGQVDREIEEALGKVRAFFDVDRCGLFEGFPGYRGGPLDPPRHGGRYPTGSPADRLPPSFPLERLIGLSAIRKSWNSTPASTHRRQPSTAPVQRRWDKDHPEDPAPLRGCRPAHDCNQRREGREGLAEGIPPAAPARRRSSRNSVGAETSGTRGFGRRWRRCNALRDRMQMRTCPCRERSDGRTVRRESWRARRI